VHPVYRLELVLQVLPAAPLYNDFVPEIFRAKDPVYHYLDVVDGVPVKVDKDRAVLRQELADLDKAPVHHLEVLALLPEIFKRKAAVIFNAAEVALAAQERRVDVDQINLAFKAVLEQIIGAVKVVALKEQVLLQARDARPEGEPGSLCHGWL
jgi:hypothetical protein